MGSGEKKARREINKVLNKFVLKDGEIVYPLRNFPDARDMIVEFAQPLEGLFDSLTTRYSVAIFAWNLSLIPEEQREGYIEEFITPLLGENEEGKTIITKLIHTLAERREESYPKETYLILPSEEEVDREDEEIDEDDNEYETT